MINEKSVLAVIPARGGSKGLPRKNIKELAGRPLITWTIEAGLASKYIDQLIVTTDDEEIARIATEYNATVPFIRPKHLGSDSASSYETILHALDYYFDKGESFDYLLLLQPTSPLRTTQHIDEAFCLLDSKNADSIISVTESEHSPLWSNVLPEDHNMEDFISDTCRQVTRRQDLPKYFRINGAIYIVNIKKMINEKSLFLSTNIFAYIMDRYSSVDIDDLLDLKLAELIINE
jgi:CMP-N,N'-diacetyllegionaminic acid synthase